MLTGAGFSFKVQRETLLIGDTLQKRLKNAGQRLKAFLNVPFRMTCTVSDLLLIMQLTMKDSNVF